MFHKLKFVRGLPSQTYMFSATKLFFGFLVHFKGSVQKIWDSWVAVFCYVLFRLFADLLERDYEQHFSSSCSSLLSRDIIYNLFSGKRRSLPLFFTYENTGWIQPMLWYNHVFSRPTTHPPPHTHFFIFFFQDLVVVHTVNSNLLILAAKQWKILLRDV